ncbi:MAG: type IX secretion system outer membrane channel protein PorV [Paludibacteraceae bacterium]|nr:type IX secretion system outer membrane channel protein PorV [Paludibacteraceae bacterium]MBR5825154.1 type IX secretion system outer membrane channel protein PorV [Paludibacteraceae bacterium]
MKKVLLSMMVLCASCVSIFAQESTNVSYNDAKETYGYMNPIVSGVPSMSISPDAVAGGMGDVGVATNSDMNSQYWNSSKYAQNESSAGFAFSYTPWLRKLGVNDINLLYLAGYYTPSKMAGTISASLRFFQLGEVLLRESADAIPLSANPYEMTFDLGYSRMLTENFSLGIVMRLVASDLTAKTDPNYYTGYAFGADVNGFYSLPIEMAAGTSRFNFGFNISNIGTRITYDKGDNYNFIPANLRLGVGYQLPFDQYNRLLISLEANKMMVPSRYSKIAKYNPDFDASNMDTWAMTTEEYNKISSMEGLIMSWYDAPGGFAEEMAEINWGIGLEYAYNEQFFGRLGYNNEAKDKGNRKYFTVGAGFKLSAFKLDVGYVIATSASNPLDQTLRFSLAFDIDGIKALADK